MAKKKPSLNAKAALKLVDKMIQDFEGVIPHPSHPARSVAPGKLYELHALARALSELKARGWHVFFQGSQIELKASPGMIKLNDPHFELQRNSSGPVEFRIYTDIEVQSLGKTLGSGGHVNDLSAYHEIDIVVVHEGTIGRPTPAQLALGIECKAAALFSKSYVREVLGRRRELSLLRGPSTPPLDLAGGHAVNADPPSEYWLVFIDGSGSNYTQSPRVFGVELKHWLP